MSRVPARVFAHAVTFCQAVLTAAIACPALAADKGGASTANYPNKPIRLIVPFPPGGGTDLVSRIIQPAFTAAVGQQLLIDNRGGAQGTSGTAIGAKANPDGYTLIISEIGATAVAPWMYDQVPFSVERDFAPITQLIEQPYIVSVHPTVPAKTLNDFLKLAAAKPNGGLSFRPGREAQILRKRLATHDGAFPPAAVYRMWREMMSSFALMQTPTLRIAVCRPVDQPGYWDLARDHFGCQVPMIAHESPAQVLASVRANATTIGVVPAPIEADTAPWWPLLGSGEATLPNVVAKLPFLAMPNARARGISALVLARIEPEESGDDRALIAIEALHALSRTRISGAIAKAGLPAFTSALDQTLGGVHHYLLELPGVIADRDERLRGLETALELGRGTIAAIGAYAVPGRLP